MNNAQPDATRLILIRHGVTDWNKVRRFQGQIDIPLSGDGVEQARRVAAALANRSEIAAIYSSDLKRAFQTAEPIAAVLNLPLNTDAGLRERAFGVFEGLTMSEIQSRHLAQYQRWRDREIDFGVSGGGETLRSFYGRVEQTLRRVCDRHLGETVVLVTHGGVLDCAYRATGKVALTDPFRPELPNTGVNVLLREGGQFKLQTWADVAHLN